jgi:fumarate hydratase class II
VVDVFQTGSGTSTNMNVNEVLANRANELLGKPLGGNDPVHPNDHVNRCQSSNDVIPSAIRIAARRELSDRLLPALAALRDALSGKAAEFSDVLKIGRTHLQDAVPVTLGQEFSGYASQVDHGIRRVRATFADLEELPLGGTAVGTGLNAHPEFAARTIAEIARATGIPFRPAENRFEAMGAQDPLVAASGAMKGVAASLMKIAHDLRLLSSGPRCAIGEISLPSLQPGSSIMPGKVNPVILEVAIQVAAQVIGNDAAVTLGGGLGVLELNVMLPVMARNLLESVSLLSAASSLLAGKCVEGIKPNRKRCEELVEQSLAMVTPLAVRIGYNRAAELAHEAYHTGKTIRALLTEKGVLPAEEIERILDPRTMI